jgi:hypothetical protein
MSDDAEIIAPNYRLQKKVGGSATRLLTPELHKKAADALEKVIPPIAEEVERLLREIEVAARHRDPEARDLMWANAHEIRGMAGTAGKVALGQAGNLICHYLNGTDSHFKPDANVLTTIVVVALQAMKDGADTDPMVRTLLSDSARAVIAQRTREGRAKPS